MSANLKNFVVGVAMLIGLVLLAAMIILFGKAPARLLAAHRQTVTFYSARVDGLSEGSNVLYMGVPVGTVEDVRRDPDNPRALIRTLLKDVPPLPANIIGKIHSPIVGGSSRLDLEVTGPTPQGQLAADQLIPAQYAGTDVLPPEIAELAIELRHTSMDLRQSKLIDNTNDLVKDIRTQTQHFGALVDTLNTTLSDPKMQADLKAAVANIHTVTDNATRISANVERFSDNLDHVSKRIDDLSDSATATLAKTQGDLDQVTQKVNDRLEQVAKLLETFQSISAKIDKGQGTAGLLINDNKLYQSLADTSQELKATIADLKLLIEQWTQEGVSLRMNGK